MKKIVNIFWSTIILTGCATTSAVKEPTISPLPVEPEWVAYTRAPILTEVDMGENKVNFVVSDEFVQRSIQERNYIKNIKRWKQINRVP